MIKSAITIILSAVVTFLLLQHMEDSIRADERQRVRNQIRLDVTKQIVAEAEKRSREIRHDE